MATKTPSSARMRMLVLLVVLAATWLLWSWLFKPLVLGLGVFSCLLVIYLVHRMGYFGSDLYALRLRGRFIVYWAWLLKEIFRSSIDVARIILSPSLPISPRTVQIDAGTADPVGQTTLANSITLTPGTLAFDVDEGLIQVHALTIEGADELMAGEMTRRVARLGD